MTGSYWEIMYTDLLKRVDAGEFSGKPAAPPQRALEQWESEWPDKPPGWENSEARLRLHEIIAAHTRPERECIEKPRPADCPNVMSCGWHHVKTEPEIGLYVCSAPNCPHMIQAASVARPERCTPSEGE